MDLCHNISVSGDLPANYQPEQHLVCSLDGLISGHSMEEGDVNMEWLSFFVEDCLSSNGSCMPHSTTSTAQGTNISAQPEVKKLDSTLKLIVPCKSRSTRKRRPKCWLGESELVLPKKYTSPYNNSFRQEVANNRQRQGRKCTHCLSQKTPQWRAGPKGPKTLCNACGVRYKSGRLLPEYRPAKSPTFITNKHSNSHKKVLEMRISILPSSSTNSSSFS
ncbi:hypothetical protein QVD17_00786 [Tagetes erecta]|uniref:GATA-type domain-containing protein n=1 Tax=Tagetes erecta TaxID=13708 RepID=A0AAD8P7Q6_TARER|nr:hypothetical protein QVD17_00786 [Tagetes erecta]